jgi:hypothetical protein
VAAAATRSGAVTNPIPGRVHRVVLEPTMDYGIAEVVNLQTGSYAAGDRNISGHNVQTP